MHFYVNDVQSTSVGAPQTSDFGETEHILGDIKMSQLYFIEI